MRGLIYLDSRGQHTLEKMPEKHNGVWVVTNIIRTPCCHHSLLRVMCSALKAWTRIWLLTSNSVLTSGDTGGSRRQEPCGEARRGARPWPCSWPRRCRGGWGPPGALPVSTHSKTSANQCFWTAAHFSKIFTRQSNCFEGESFCFELTASEATRPFSPCESVSMTK